jgi:hypothetical protein
MQASHYMELIISAVFEVCIDIFSLEVTLFKRFQVYRRHLEDFVTTKSMICFQLLELPAGYLKVDPDLWELREDYKQAKEIIKSINVVNDHAERGVALIQEYSGLLTHDEMQLQFLLQVVENHRKMYPDSVKKTLSQPL